MIIFEFILIMLAAVLLSNLINRFVPALSVPLIQIVLGVIIAIIPFGAFGFEFELKPELFFVLFIAPLVFHESYTADKKTLWEMKVPILGAAVVLVFLIVIAVGYFTHLLIPAIPLAAAFALIGALGPTDDIAVDAVSKRVTIPRKIMGILSGESIINDASGIICFQFAIIAMTTGSFSLKQASFQFILLGIGGLLAGILLTWLKYVFIKKLHVLGIRNVTLHILIEILTPFIIYMIAEFLAVSGILAIFAAGISHSFLHDKFNPEKIKLTIAQDSVWEFITFILNGLVFVMLGTQLPGIVKTINFGVFSLNGLEITGCILLLTIIFITLRFLWWLITVHKKTYHETEYPISSAKAAVIFSLAGARGTVTLASVMSIPFVLDNGAAFPERDLIILLASGVIIVSMLITNFVLPLFVKCKSNEIQSNAEQAAYSEIVQDVITRLMRESTDENRLATEIVIRNYIKRNAVVQNSNYGQKEPYSETELRKQIFLWEKENTSALLADESTDKATAEHYLEIITERANILENNGKEKIFTKIAWFFKHLLKFHRKKDSLPKHSAFKAIIDSNQKYVLEKLNKIKNEKNAALIEKLAAEFDLRSAFAINRGKSHPNSQPSSSVANSAIFAVASHGFSIERELIQEMFETNRITREIAKEMRVAIATVEAQLQNDIQ